MCLCCWLIYFQENKSSLPWRWSPPFMVVPALKTATQQESIFLVCLPLYARSGFSWRQQQSGQQLTYKIGTSPTAPKLCSLPPMTVSFEKYFRRAHHQLALWLWYSALRRCPCPECCRVWLGMTWYQQTINPTERADVVSYAPEHILMLVRSLHGAPTGLHNVLWLW